MQVLLRGEPQNCPSCNYLLIAEDHIDHVKIVLRSSEKPVKRLDSGIYYCPECSGIIQEDVIKNLKEGKYQTCLNCGCILRGDEFKLDVQDAKSKKESSIISTLANKMQEKKKRKLSAYFCPFCSDPSSRLTENQLNLIEMGLSVECKKCGKSIKNEDLEI